MQFLQFFERYGTYAYRMALQGNSLQISFSYTEAVRL